MVEMIEGLMKSSENRVMVLYKNKMKPAGHSGHKYLYRCQAGYYHVYSALPRCQKCRISKEAGNLISAVEKSREPGSILLLQRRRKPRPFGKL